MARLCFLFLLLATAAAHAADRESMFTTARRVMAQLTGKGRGDAMQMSDFLVPETIQPQLMEPLWRSDEHDDIFDATIENSGRVLQGNGNAEEDFIAGSSDPDPDPQPNPARNGLKNEDFVYVAPTNPTRLPLAQASRYWRKGMRAVFVMDVPEDRVPLALTASAERFRESFAWYPNFRRMANDKRDHYLEGDRRAAMTPVLGYAALTDRSSMLPWTAMPQPEQPPASSQQKQQQPAAAKAAPEGTRVEAAVVQKRKLAAVDGGSGSNGTDPFLWMLAGDDDTIFFMRGVKALLRDYDPQLPYFLTDSMYVGSKSPQPGVWDFRCYPCHLQWGKWRRASRRLMAEGDSKPSTGPKGCDCSTAALCKKRFPNNQTLCQTEMEGPVPFGGVGFIFSIGFFKMLAASQGGKGLKAYETCVNAPETSCMSFPEGGDAFMSRCFWRLGFPITDPGYTQFGRYMGEILHLHNLYEAPANLTKNELPKDAMGRWSQAVSMHLGARQQRSFRAAAMTIKYITSVYDMVAEMLWPSHRKSD